MIDQLPISFDDQSRFFLARSRSFFVSIFGRLPAPAVIYTSSDYLVCSEILRLPFVLCWTASEFPITTGALSFWLSDLWSRIANSPPLPLLNLHSYERVAHCSQYVYSHSGRRSRSLIVVVVEAGLAINDYYYWRQATSAIDAATIWADLRWVVAPHKDYPWPNPSSTRSHWNERSPSGHAHRMASQCSSVSVKCNVVLRSELPLIKSEQNEGERERAWRWGGYKTENEKRNLKLTEVFPGTRPSCWA